jgi:hypothetical protein
MEYRGLRPTNGRPYRQIASLLYEAITGEQGQDIERACKAMLRAAIRTE